jgi:hypothetical protein
MEDHVEELACRRHGATMSDPRRLLDIQLEMLNAELKHVDAAIRQHDEITKSIKNWAVLTWAGSIGLALQQADLRPSVWMTAVVPLMFWIVDGSFRKIQRSFIGRIREISDYVNSARFRAAVEAGSALEFPLLIMRRKTNDFSYTLMGAMLFRSVWVLYVGMVMCSLAVWIARPVASSFSTASPAAISPETRH